jgi:hypothetical protein
VQGPCDDYWTEFFAKHSQTQKQRTRRQVVLGNGRIVKAEQPFPSSEVRFIFFSFFFFFFLVFVYSPLSFRSARAMVQAWTYLTRFANAVRRENRRVRRSHGALPAQTCRDTRSTSNCTMAASRLSCTHVVERGHQLSLAGKCHPKPRPQRISRTARQTTTIWRPS